MGLLPQDDTWDSVDTNNVRTSDCDVDGDYKIDAEDVAIVQSRLGMIGG